jgi:hypothetical protein
MIKNRLDLIESACCIGLLVGSCCVLRRRIHIPTSSSFRVRADAEMPDSVRYARHRRRVHNSSKGRALLASTRKHEEMSEKLATCLSLTLRL